MGTPGKEEARRKLLDIVGDYDDATAYEDLTDDEKKEIARFAEMSDGEKQRLIGRAGQESRLTPNFHLD